MSKLKGITDIIKKHKKLVVLGVVGVTVAAVGTTTINGLNKKKEEMMAMLNQTQTSKVERRTLVSSVSATGTVTSVESKNVTANLNGMEIKSISVEVGDEVETGQVICILDSKDIEKNIEDTQLALNIATEKTKMDLTAAERNLENAQEDFNTSVERGTEDLTDVYSDYADALAEEKEAEDDWEEAKKATKDRKEEYEHRQDLLEKAKEKLNAAGSSATYAANFNGKKQELLAYNGNGINIKQEILNQIVLGSSMSFSQLSIGAETDDQIQLTSADADGETPVNEPPVNDTLDENNANVETIAETVENENQEESKEYEGNGTTVSEEEIRNILLDLDRLNAAYKKSLSLEEECSYLQQQVSAWEVKYNTAQQEESSAEKLYEQAVSVSESQLNAYEKQQRSYNDTMKNGENSILSKNESLYSSQLNSLTSGNSEEKKLEDYQEQLQDCNVKAPISGVVTAVNVEAGDMYNGSAIVTIEDISSYEVSAEIDEYDIGKIEKGQKVIIKTNATGDEELEGTVVRIAPRASIGGSEVTYTVAISIDTPNDLIRMDMTAKLSIILESKENILTVPYEAVQEEESGKFYVEVVTDDTTETATEQMSHMQEEAGQRPNAVPAENRAKGNKNQAGSEAKETVTTKKIYVEKGIESDYYIEIISSEITEGMEIVVPDSGNRGGKSIQDMMMLQGPMGGF